MHIQYEMPQLCDAQEKRLHDHVRTLSLCRFLGQCQKGVKVKSGLFRAIAKMLETLARSVSGDSEKMLNINRRWSSLV